MCYLTNFINFLLYIIALTEIFKGGLAVRRGPHHPRGEQKRRVDPHLMHEDEHMEIDLREMGVKVNLKDMSEEELTFYYFKIHDNDNNNALDGLEMLQAAVHQDQHFKTLDPSHNNINHKASSDEFEHIIDVIDEFLLIADVNKDGFLHYPEYVKAVVRDAKY